MPIIASPVYGAIEQLTDRLPQGMPPYVAPARSCPPCAVGTACRRRWPWVATGAAAGVAGLFTIVALAWPSGR